MKKIGLGCLLLGALLQAFGGSDEVTLQSVPPGGFAAGRHYELKVPFPDKGQSCTFTSGRTVSYEQTRRDGSKYPVTEVRRMVIGIPRRGTRGEVLFAPHYGPDNPRESVYRLNATMPESNFAALDDAARWQELAVRNARRDAAKELFRIGVTVREDAYVFFANGSYVGRLPREDGDTPGFVFPKDWQPEAKLAVRDVDPRYFTLDVSERANARGFSSRRFAPAGTVTNVCDVPFVLSSAKSESIDLFDSLFDCCTRTGLGITMPWNRWRNPLEKFPLRYAFSVPGGDYDALYVLCATDGSRKNAIPRFTAQFYRGDGGRAQGRPFNFRSEAVPVSKKGELYLVKVPLSGDFRTELGPERTIYLELTKDVELYRTYPDVFNYSFHAAGLPSAVKVFGVTLGCSETRIRFDPDEIANVFNEGQDVSYTVTVENMRPVAREERFRFTAVSWDGQKRHEDTKDVKLAPGERRQVKFAFRPERYGWHEVRLEQEGGRSFRHSAAYLRKRDYSRRPFETEGLRFGCWNMFSTRVNATVCGKAGFDTYRAERVPADLMDVHEKYGFAGFATPGGLRATSAVVIGDDFETNIVRFTRAWGKSRMGDPASANWKYATCLAEPGGIKASTGNFAEFYGEPENAYDYRRLTGKEKERYEAFKERIRVGMEAFKRLYPGVKRLTPHGNWNFMIPYLQDPDTRFLFDGFEGDFQYFAHLPEEQILQTSVHSLWYFKQAWDKYRPGERIFVTWGEGPDILQVYPGALTEEESAAHRVRCSILMAGYGVTSQLSWGTNPTSFAEHHCAGGLITGKYANDPDWAYAACATWTRLTRNARFESYTNPGSTSAYCANFRDDGTKELFRAIWSVHGRREFVFDCAPGKLRVLDPMDNEVAAEARDGKAVVTVGQMPYFVFGAENCEPRVGASDHSDSALAAGAVRLGNLAESFKEQGADDDDNYVNFMPDYIRRFAVPMDVKPVDCEKGKALSVGLPPQKTDRMTMPYYSCLRLKKPITIPGKAEFLRLDVKAASDWGRVVFVLRDAAGKAFYSNGMKGQWNVDDQYGESHFSFDGWRTLRIELPSNAPWDSFREKGFSTWGAADIRAVVELPLAIEKVFVERRSGCLYGNEFVRFASDTPVLLGDLHAEYASEADKGDAAVKLSKLRMPKVSESQLPNPIREMAANELPAGRITAVKEPETWFNGTNGDFHFDLPEEAASWDVYLSLKKDGRGAIRQKKNITKNPCNVGGFLADTTFYAFVVWRDKSGKESKPSEPLEFRLSDHFGHQ